jgi:hypothetical protein
MGTSSQKSITKSTCQKILIQSKQPIYRIDIMEKRNAFYAQSGGVTAVINATACGVIETARKHKNKIGKVYAGRNGIIGALTEDLIDTSKESASAIAALKHTPSGAFGSCRYKLKSVEESREQYERLIDVFKAHNIGVKKWATRFNVSVFPKLLIMIYRLLTTAQDLVQLQNM